jgi:hypothetical protein
MITFKQHITKDSVDEDLRQWFKQKWVRMDTKGNIKGQCAREPGEGKPKCLPQAKAHALGKEGRASAARRKRREDPNPERKGKAINVRTEQIKSFKAFNEEYYQTLEEKNTPTHPEKWARAKSAAKSKFAVYPSAYANAWASKKYKSMGGGWRSTNEDVDHTHAVHFKDKKTGEWVGKMLLVAKDDKDAKKQAHDLLKGPEFSDKDIDSVIRHEIIESTPAWQRSAGKDPEGGLNRKGIASYRRENPGSKLSMAVTTKPSKLKPGSKAANRRKSFCSRMKGMKAKLTSAKTAKDPDSRINKSLRKWNC